MKDSGHSKILAAIREPELAAMVCLWAIVMGALPFIFNAARDLPGLFGFISAIIIALFALSVSLVAIYRRRRFERPAADYSGESPAPLGASRGQQLEKRPEK